MAGKRTTLRNWRELTWGELFYIIACVLFAVVLVRALPVSLKFNTTESVPVGFYWVDGRRAPMLGELGLFAAPDPVNYSDSTTRALMSRNIPLLKTIGAVEGDYLTTEGNYVWKCPDQGTVDSRCTLLGVGVGKDAKGRPLTMWPYNKTRVEHGQVYLGNLAAHPRAFDSRYFGLIELSTSKGVAYPLGRH